MTPALEGLSERVGVLAERVTALVGRVNHVDDCIDDVRSKLFDDEHGKVAKLERKVDFLDRRQERMIFVFAISIVVMNFLSGSGAVSLEKLLPIIKGVIGK